MTEVPLEVAIRAFFAGKLLLVKVLQLAWSEEYFYRVVEYKLEHVFLLS